MVGIFSYNYQGELRHEFTIETIKTQLLIPLVRIDDSDTNSPKDEK